MTATTYFIANRIWWAAALFIAPVVAAVSGDVVVGIGALFVLVLPTAVIFDADRRWWSDEFKAVMQDKAGIRREVRLLTLSAAVGLALGLVTAFLLG